MSSAKCFKKTSLMAKIVVLSNGKRLISAIYSPQSTYKARTVFRYKRRAINLYYTSLVYPISYVNCNSINVR